MADEYISREAVMQKFLERGSGYITELTMRDMINEIPAADVQPVKRGRWINTNMPNRFRCSCCDVTHFITQYPLGDINYCPNCGADMREGAEN